MNLFRYLAENAPARRTFSQAMAETTALVSFAVAVAYDFSSFSAVVEVRGGHGALIRAILMANPKLKGVLFDTPQVIEEAQKYFSTHGLDGRCQSIGGNFFESVPHCGDAYIMKHIIHDWDDDHSIAILENCRRAIVENGRVLLVETLMPLDGESSFESLMDLNMLVKFGGRERSKAEQSGISSSV